MSQLSSGGRTKGLEPAEHHSKPQKPTTSNSTLTGPDLGVGLVVVFWMWGLALPISGVWQLLRHRKTSQLLLYTALQVVLCHRIAAS